MIKLLKANPEEIAESFSKGDITIAVVGTGHVGLPLAVLLAEEGAEVIGSVLTQEEANRINQGQAHMVEFDVSSLLQAGAKRLDVLCPSCGISLIQLDKEEFCPYCGRQASVTQFSVNLSDNIASAYQRIITTQHNLETLMEKALKTGKLHATVKTTDAVRRADAVLIMVGSPIDEQKVPNYVNLKKACHSVGKGLQKGQLVILKSTVSPGTTKNLVKPILESESGLEAGEDFGLAFMPETIYEGHALYNFKVLPKIVGGITERCAQAAANLFSILPAPVYIYEDTATVEVAKLFMNIYRDVNIALANELALICEKLEINATTAISAANAEQKTHLLTPGLVGGYCLPKDTYHLVHPAQVNGYRPRLITLARQINDAIPEHILDLVNDAFQEMGTPLKGARIAVLGLGFKANSGDLRSTPAEPIIRSLFEKGASPIAHDSFVELDDVKHLLPELTCSRNLEKTIRNAVCTLIVTDHLEYRRLTADYLQRLMAKPCAIVDARHIINPRQIPSDVTFRSFGKPIKHSLKTG
jgi:UDP-N-acetyl-D-mannosaminuronic acid dehydrogenase